MSAANRYRRCIAFSLCWLLVMLFAVSPHQALFSGAISFMFCVIGIVIDERRKSE